MAPFPFFLSHPKNHLLPFKNHEEIDKTKQNISMHTWFSYDYSTNSQGVRNTYELLLNGLSTQPFYSFFQDIDNVNATTKKGRRKLKNKEERFLCWFGSAR